MTVSWVFLSLLSAFGQALGWALKKKTLESRGLNNTLGAVSFLTAGTLLLAMFVAVHGGAWPVVSQRFWEAASVVIGTNVLAVWAAYRALDRAPLSLLMPFIALSALGIVPIEFLTRGVWPTGVQTIGIALIVVGAVLFAAKQIPDRKTLKAVGYFAVTVLCFCIAPPFMAIAVEETQSGLFSAAVFHLAIALGFVPLIFMAKEARAVEVVFRSGEWMRLLLLMIAAGACIAVLENGPATVALLTAKASEVMALKRTMPFFALVLGMFMFGEKVTKKHMIGTALLVSGSVLMIWFR